LNAVQSAAASVLAAGGLNTSEGRRRLVELDVICRSQHLSPGGSGDLLAVTLFLDAVDKRMGEQCKR
jgi:triphosphoribosyl-dephospho-CoA synthase